MKAALAVIGDPRTFWPALLSAAAVLGATAVIGPVLGLFAVAVLAGAAALVHAGGLIRLALRIHHGRRDFGPCRGAGFLGLGALLAGAGVAATGLPWLDPGPIAAATTLLAAPAYLAGLLLLPGTAPTLGARLRRLLDGAGIGVSLLYCAWVVTLGRSAPGTAPLRLAVALTGCVAVAVAVVTGLRAVRHRPAALGCSGGAALSIVGVEGYALLLLGHDRTWLGAPGAAPAGLVAAGLAMVAGPFLIAAGARRAGDGPTRPHAADEDGSFAGYPLLLVPALLAVVVSAWHLLTGGRFDETSVALGIAAFAALAVRELFVAWDIRRYAQTLAGREARFRTLVAGSTDVAIVLDADLVVRWQSPAAARQFGLSDQDALGRPLTDLLHPADAAPVAAALRAVLERDAPGRPLTGPLHPADTAALRDPLGRPLTGLPHPAGAAALRDALGRPLTDPLHPAGAALRAVPEGRQHVLVQARLRDGFGRWRDTESTVIDQRAAPEVGGLVVHVRDIGDRARLQRTLHEVTWTDDRTGLANRRRFVAAAEEACRDARPGSLLVLELDRFDSVADLHGPSVAGAVLIEAARRLRAAAGRDDLPARLGAAAFAVLTDAPLVPAFALAARIATALAEPFHLPGHTVHLAADVGVADLLGAGHAEEALRHADVARRRARQLARGGAGGRVECYDKSFETALVRRTEIEQQLPGVIGRGELDVAFQPIADLATRQPAGTEALLRWRHPRLGTVPPAEFLPIAEELGGGIADEIGEWVLHRACRQLSRWRGDGRDLWMSVNVSARQLAGEGWLAAVATAVDTHCVPAEALVVEVAEAALPDDAFAVEQLAGLRALGVRTALDHFGTGPTALAHLRRLPIDVLKIDQALFNEPPGRRGAATPIVDVVVGLSRRLGIDVIACGLETQSHADVVRAAGCALGQGFLVSPPDHAEHVEAYLERHRTPLLGK
ncbi:EAL domain-containing protein [Dactylosporangium sp. NPDC051485]|uniref:putative bifunctional diguanylate cyclase/phosphodiesterase n=1 Tax=Dactylosporangium sp. NPDC051485 TaxID=3154846 RepID=UPI00341A6A76